MRVFGIDPGSVCTGYGCVDSDGQRHRLVVCGAIRTAKAEALADRLALIYRELTTLIHDCRPECVVVENVFHAANVQSALKLGHARAVAMLAGVEAGVPVVEYTPAEVKRSIVGYGRAEKHQVQHMIKLLLGLDRAPSPHDAADALAIAICHLHAGKWGRSTSPLNRAMDGRSGRPGSATAPKSWRQYKPRGGTPAA